MHKDSAEIARIVVNWTLGFLSGWNFANSLKNDSEADFSTFDASTDAVHVRILAHCYENPQDPLMGAAVALYLSMPQIVGHTDR